MILSIVSGFLSGFVFAVLYAILYRGVPGVGLKKGVVFGVLIWIIGSLLPNWWSYLSTTSPEIYVFVDTLRGFARYIFLGVVCSIIYKE